MDFTVPARAAAAVAKIRDFVDTEVIPLESRLAGGSFVALAPELNALRQAARELGLWTPQLSEEWEAWFLLMEFAHISEALGRTPFGHYVFNCQAPDAGNMEILIEFGTDEQRAQWLTPLAAGDIRSCFSMTEPDSPGSNPTWMNTMAVDDGDSWVINGHKWFTSSADGAAFAIVMAVTDPDAESRYARASQIIVPTDTPGFNIVRNISVMGEPGDGWASHSEVTYEDVRVPKANLLGPRGGGFVVAQERLGPGRIHHCMRWIGICERAFELMCKRAATREVAPGRPLGTRQSVQNWIAESRAEIDAARLMVLNAAWRIDPVGAHAARVEVSTIKFFVAGVMQRVLDRSLQAHGALGMTDDLPIAWWYRHERAARIYDGPDEVHKTVVARRVLREYGVEDQVMSDGIDKPRDVRDGEALPMDALRAYLGDQLGRDMSSLTVKQFPSGYSNLTYCLNIEDDEWVLRRPPFGANVKSGHDMSREWTILSALKATGLAPTPLVNCTNDDVIGAPFYVMERVKGVILRGAQPSIDLNEDEMAQACRALVETQAAIHDVDLAANGLSDFGRPEGYVLRQVEGWTRRWHNAKTDEVEAMETTAAWLAENLPQPVPATLIHNDFKYDNVVYQPGDFGTVRAVLDWELATVGDPLMDLGTSLAYWIEAEDDPVLQSVAGPTSRVGNMRRREVAEYYAELTGRSLDDLLFYYVQGLFKVGVIGQQIYYRFKHGHTKDPRFAGLIFLVNAAAQRAARAIEAQEI